MTWPKQYGGHERSFLERYVVTEEFRVANAPVRLHFVADRQSGPVHHQVRQRADQGRRAAAHLQGRGVLRHRHERAGLGLRPVRGEDQGHQDQGRLAHQRHQDVDQQRAPGALPDRAVPHLGADQGEPPARAHAVPGGHEDAGHRRQPDLSDDGPARLQRGGVPGCLHAGRPRARRGGRRLEAGDHASWPTSAAGPSASWRRTTC